MSAAALEPTAAPPRVWELELPCGELLNANNESGRHWAHRQRITRRIQEEVGWLARRLKIPRLQVLEVRTIVLPPDRGKRDPDNWFPTTKAAVDGLVAVRIVPDDNPPYVLNKGYELGQPHRHECWLGAGGPRRRRRVHVKLILTAPAVLL